MSNITPFNYNTHDVRVVTGEDGEPWFVGKDVAEILGYKKPENAIARHCKAQVTTPKQGGGVFTIIPERDLYRLVIKSKLPAAEQFEEWVVGEVLPTIRKTGGTYMTDDALAKTLEDPDYMIGVLTKLKQLKAERDAALLREELAIKTKAEIGSRREATAMASASTAKRQLNAIEEKYRTKTHLPTRGIKWLNQFFKKNKGTHVSKVIGLDLKRISEEMGFEIIKIPDETYDEINAYHRDVIAVFKGHVERGEIRPILNAYLKVVI